MRHWPAKNSNFLDISCSFIKWGIYLVAPKLIIEPDLLTDLKAHLGGGRIEPAIAAQAFMVLVWGEEGSSLGPLYEGAARRVWRIGGTGGGAGGPPPEVWVFDWGGDHLGVTPLRVWYLRNPGAGNRGIGAFPATPAPPYAEEGELLKRIRDELGDEAQLSESDTGSVKGKP